MFNQITNLPNPLFQSRQTTPLTQPDQSAAINLFTGFNLITKILITPSQWNHQFSKIQNTRLSSDYNSLKYYSDKSLSTQPITIPTNNNISLKQCQLCKLQHSTQSFFLMSKCDHQFCYSCLNVYAIAKINTHQRVKCPETTCSYQLKISSQIYKNLPETVKLKYLQWKLQNKGKKISLSDVCSRCLDKTHSGQCKVQFSKQSIESAFHYRKCFKCQTEARIQPGMKQMQCNSCNLIFCYQCGQAWPLEGKHSCLNNKKILNMEKEIKEYNDEQKNEYCCQDSDCRCIKNTGKCLQNVFYCRRCELGICLGNFLLLPIRMIGSGIIMSLYSLVLVLVVMILLGWMMTGITTGMTCQYCQMLGQMNGGMQAIAILGYPIFMLVGIFKGLKKFYRPFIQAMKSLMDFYSTAMCEMWIRLGPKECCI